jgi:hypothetical protein
MLRVDIENFQPDVHQPDLTNDRLEAIAKDIETLTATATLRIGAKLAEAREVFRYRRDEGGFAGWVESRLGYSRQHAYNFLHVHERFGGQEVSKCFDTLARSVVFLISAPGTPREASAEIIERAEAGEPMPVAEVKRTIDARKGRTSARRRGPLSTEEIEHVVKRAGGKTPLSSEEIERIVKRAETRGRTKAKSRPDDVGEHSTGEAERLRAHVDELCSEKRSLEIRLQGFQSEIEELRAATQPPVDDGIPEFLRRRSAPQLADALGWWRGASLDERRQFLAGVNLAEILGAMPADWRATFAPPPVVDDDGGTNGKEVT